MVKSAIKMDISCKCTNVSCEYKIIPPCCCLLPYEQVYYDKNMTAENLTLREQKNIHNHEALSKALAYYMEKNSIADISIRNICMRAHLSTSSFYNMYESLQQFMTEYLITDYENYNAQYIKEHTGFNEKTNIDKIIDMYVRYVKYCEEKGYMTIYTFFASFVDAFSLLNFQTKIANSKNYISEEIYSYLKAAQNEKAIDKKFNLDIISMNLYYIISGIISNWCISRGKIQLVASAQSQITSYFEPQLTSFYYDFFVTHTDVY